MTLILCQWCRKTLVEHRDDGPDARMPCLGKKSGFLPAVAKPDEPHPLHTSEIMILARLKMGNPHVSVAQNPEGVWHAEATDFACAQGVEIHGLSEEFVRNALVETLRAFPDLEAT